MMRAFALLSLASCAEHLSIGSLDDARAPDVLPEDAASPMDAAIDASLDARRNETLDAAQRDDARSEGWPLTASVFAFGRSDIELAWGRCGAPCADFEVRVQGGRPPYQVTWGDGETNAFRSICPAESPHSPDAPWTAQVTDSSSSQNVLPLFQTLGSDDGCDGGQPHWQICLESPSEAPLGCDSGTWYALPSPLRSAKVDLDAYLYVTLLTSSDIELYVASEPCGTTRLVAQASVSFIQRTVQGTSEALAEPIQYFVLKSPSEPQQRLPVELSAAIHPCFDL